MIQTMKQNIQDLNQKFSQQKRLIDDYTTKIQDFSYKQNVQVLQAQLDRFTALEARVDDLFEKQIKLRNPLRPDKAVEMNVGPTNM